VTFGTPPQPYYTFGIGADFQKQYVYVVAYGEDQTQAWIVTIDIETMAEIKRVPLYRTDGQTNYLSGWVTALEGSDYVMCSMQSHYTSPSTFDAYDLALINVNTGKVTILPMVWTNGDTYECFPQRATVFQTGGSAKYIVVCGVWYGDPGSAGCASPFVIVDTTDESMSYLYHPSSDDIVGGNRPIWEIDFGPIVNDQLICFAVYASQGYSSSGDTSLNKVYRYLVDENGVTGDVYWDSGSNVNRPVSVAYNTVNASLVVLTWDNYILKFAADGTVTALNHTNFTGYYYGVYPYLGPQWWFCNHGMQDSYGTIARAAPGFVVASDGSSVNGWYRVNLSTGEITDILGSASPSYNSPSAYVIIDDVGGWLAGDYTAPFHTDWTGQLEVWKAGSITPNLIDLQEILTALMTFNGRFSASDLSFSNFPGQECYGVKYEEDTSISDAIQTIIEPFDIVKVESDGKLKFRYPKRDGAYAVDVVIDSDQLVDSGSHRIIKNISPEEQSLSEISISHYDKTNYGERGEQPFKRPGGIYDLTKSIQKRSFNLPLYMTPAQAQKLAATMVYRSVYDLETYQIMVGPAYAYLEPGDIVEFTFNGATVSGQIKQAELNADYSQKLTVHQYMQAIEATYNGVQRYVTEYVPKIFTSEFLYLDIPLISEFDDEGGAALVEYGIVTGTKTGEYVGGSLYEEDSVATSYQTSDGAYWSKIGTTTRSAPIGVITAISGTPSDPFLTDHVNTIDLVITNGDSSLIDSIDDDGLAANRNIAVIGAAGRWVMIAFRDVSVSGSTITLSEIRFGINGTEVYLSQLAAGDTFAFLDFYLPLKFTNPVADLNTDHSYKAASSYYALDDVTTKIETSAGVAETPYAPVHLNAVIHGSDIEFTWDWRSRLSPVEIFTGAADTIYGEATLEFELEVMSDVSPDTVIRTYTGITTNSKLYDSTDIVTDFGSIPATITFRVYQVSAVVGRGYAGEATITL